MKVEHHCRGRWPRAASGRGSRLPPRGPVRRPSPHAAPSPGPAVPDSTRSVLPPKRKRVARTCQATGGRLLVHRPPSGRGPGASAAPAVPAPRAHRAHRTGMWSPAPRKPPWGFLLLEKQRWAEPSAGGSEPASTPFSGTPRQRGCPRRSGRGHRGRGASTQCGFQVSGPRLERPPGLPPETRGPGRRRAAPRTSPSAHLAKTNTFGGKDHTRQQEEQGGGRCRHRKPHESLSALQHVK